MARRRGKESYNKSRMSLKQRSRMRISKCTRDTQGTRSTVLSRVFEPQGPTDPMAMKNFEKDADGMTTPTKGSTFLITPTKIVSVDDCMPDGGVFPLPLDDPADEYMNMEKDIDNQLLVTTPAKGTDDTSFVPEGRRIVDVHHFAQALLQFPKHGPLECNSSNMKIIKEHKEGLRSKFFIECTFCGYEGAVTTEPDANSLMDANTSAVVGSIAVGIGHSQLDEFLSSMNLPSLSFPYYKKLEANVGKNLSDTAWEEMKAAAEEEARIAREIGDVDVDGVPLIAVSADGSWAKRSYRSQYNSQSGMAAIVGVMTNKVLFVAVKNKYCSVCTMAKARKLNPTPEHTCFKNWNATSSSMESEAILEGFKMSVEMYGLRYNKLIADGDSSTYNKLLANRPYPQLTIEKVECANHLLRNYCLKLKGLAQNKLAGQKKLRSVLEANVIRLRKAINVASVYWKNQDGPLDVRIRNLRNEILHIPSHVFGDHSNCGQHFCQGAKDGEVNVVPDMQLDGLWGKMKEIVYHLACHSSSLIQKLTSNTVENFNSIIAKHIGGKRLNFTKRGSYQHRVMSAVVSHNSRALQSKLHKKMFNKSPGTFVKKLERKHRMNLKKVSEWRLQNPRRRRILFNDKKDPGEYGLNANQPDMPESEYIIRKREFLGELHLDDSERGSLELSTRTQSADVRWREERRKRITASNFGAVCARKSTTLCANLVKTLLYSKDFQSEGMHYGSLYEGTAIRIFEERSGLSVSQSGLFVDPEKPFLGASPEGLVGTDGVVEVKCPSSLKDKAPLEAIKTKKFPFLKVIDGEITINKRHKFYYQVQGELHVTRRQMCYFIIYTQVPPNIEVVAIKKDDQFWLKNMEPKLEKFYHDCVLPELIDPRQSRSMPLREPQYILDAREASKLKRTRKASPTRGEFTCSECSEKYTMRRLLKNHIFKNHIVRFQMATMQ